MKKENCQKIIFNNFEKTLQLISFNQEIRTITYDEIITIQIYFKRLFKGYTVATFLIQLSNGALIDLSIPSVSLFGLNEVFWSWELSSKLKEKMSSIPLDIVIR